MKKICLLLLSIVFASQGFAKNDTIRNPTVPKDIVASFAKTHPDAKLMTWSKANNIYIVSYRENNANLWTTYDSNGALLENKWKIQAKDLPVAAQDFIKKNNTQGIQEYYKSTDASGAIYYEVSSPDKSYVFDAEGTHFKTIESVKK